MIKVKDYKYSISSSESSGDIIEIKSLNEQDLVFYTDWCKSHFNSGYIESLSAGEIERVIQRDIKIHFVYIIRNNTVPCGEIIFWNDKSLTFEYNLFEKPVYNIWFKYYENVDDITKIESLELFLELSRTIDPKMKTMYTLISQDAEEDKPVYEKCGFIKVDPSAYKSKMEKFMKAKDMENVYRTSGMYVLDMKGA